MLGRQVGGDNSHLVRHRILRPNGTEVRLRGHKEAVISAEFSADGKTLVTVSEDGTIRAWRSDTWSEMWSAPAATHSVDVIAAADSDIFGVLQSHTLQLRGRDGEVLGESELPDATCVAISGSQHGLIAAATKGADVQLKTFAGVNRASIRLGFAVKAMAFNGPQHLVVVDGAGAISRFEIPTESA